MNTAHFEKYRVVFEPLSPVHIGSGLSIEPCEYDLRTRGKACFLCALDLPQIISNLHPQQRQELYALMDKADYVGVRSWLTRYALNRAKPLFTVRVEQDVFEEIKNNIDNPHRLGQIDLFVRDPASGRPYIPGSSIKGALRTAVVDALARRDRNIQSQLQQLAASAGGPESPKGDNAAIFEARALGYYTAEEQKRNLYRDPFRQLAISDLSMPDAPVVAQRFRREELAISDLSMPDGPTIIDRITIIRPGGAASGGRPVSGSGQEKIIIYREVTNMYVPLRIVGEARLYSGLAARGAVPMRLDLATLCRQCNDFYIPRLKEELRLFVTDEAISGPLLDAASGLKGLQCLIRLGRHSHFECVTVGPPFRRSPASRRSSSANATPENADRRPRADALIVGKTRSYVAGKLPLGWAILSFERIGSQAPA